MAAVDWNDPCARFAALQSAYYQIISGGSTATIEYTANGATRKVSYSFSDNKSLRQRMLEAEDACALLNGRPAHNRRFAIQAGARRRSNWGDPFSSNNV